GFLENILDPTACPLSSVPNLCYKSGNELIVTPEQSLALGAQMYPSLPLEVFDPRVYWESLPRSDIHASGKDGISNVPVGRTVVGAKVVTGCTYRRGMLQHGKEACSYCTLTSLYEAASGPNFWRITEEMLAYVESIPWTGHRGIRCYQIGDDMGSDIPLLK